MRRLQRHHGYYCAFCFFSSKGNIIQQKNKKNDAFYDSCRRLRPGNEYKKLSCVNCLRLKNVPCLSSLEKRVNRSSNILQDKKLITWNLGLIWLSHVMLK